MNRFVVAEPLWCTGCNTCLAACSDVHKTQGLQQHPRLALAKTSTITAPVEKTLTKSSWTKFLKWREYLSAKREMFVK